MMHIWIVMICIDQGYSLMSVSTGELGDPVTFVCRFSDVEYSSTRVKWYKQSIGDTLTLITTLMETTTNPSFEEGFPSSRFAANYSSEESTLTILKTVPEDEALYHCSISTWKTDQWTGTFLSLKENRKTTANYTVVQWPAVFDPVQPGDSVTLQCSIVSNSPKYSCPSDHSVSWFVVREDKVLGNVIYTNGNRPYKCDRKRDTKTPSKSCIYHLSKNVSASDSGTYYCALARCGEIIFGNGAKLEIEDVSRLSLGGLRFPSVLTLMCTVLTLTVLTCLFALIKKKFDSCKAAVCLQTNNGKQNVKREEETEIYSTALFTVIKNMNAEGKNAKPIKRETTFAAFKASEAD